MRRPGPESNPRALAGWALLGLIGLWGWSGCKAPETADPGAVVVATAYGDALTVADLLAEVPPGLTARDSAGWADRIIADWQQRRTLVHLAKTELPEMELDFEREVTKYRETLYLHAYEDRYLRDHLDTAISVAELQAFLDEQPGLFRLAEPLYRARWMVFPDEAPFPRDIRGLQKQLASKDPEELSSLASRCADAGLPFDLDAERRWTWEELGAVVPLEPRKAARQQSSRRVTKIDWPADGRRPPRPTGPAPRDRPPRHRLGQPRGARRRPHFRAAPAPAPQPYLGGHAPASRPGRLGRGRAQQSRPGRHHGPELRIERHPMTRLFALLACVLLATGLIAQTEPELQKLEQIVAVVGNEIVLQSDVDAQLFQMEASGMPVGDVCPVVEQLMLQKLLLHQARLDSIEVDDGEVTAQIDRRLEYYISMFGSVEAFEAEYGKTVAAWKAEFREPMKEQIMADRMQAEIEGGPRHAAGHRDHFAAIPPTACRSSQRKCATAASSLSRS